MIGLTSRRRIGSFNGCLVRRALGVGQARKVVHDKKEYFGFVREEWFGFSKGDEPLNLMKCRNKIHYFSFPNFFILTVLMYANPMSMRGGLA